MNHLNLTFAKHMWRFPKLQGPKLLDLVYEQEAPYSVRVLHSKRQINQFLHEELGS